MYLSRSFRSLSLLAIAGFATLSMSGFTATPGSPTAAAEPTIDASADAAVAGLAQDGTVPMVVGGAAGPCGTGLAEVAPLAGGTLCTHGPDAPTPAMAPSSASPETTAGIQCYGSGTDGARVQLIYIHTSAVDRLSTLRSGMHTRAAQMDTIFNASAAQTGGQRHIRFVTDANCNLDIDDVIVPANAIPPSGFNTMVNALIAKGYTDPNRKYVVIADTNAATPSMCYGLATLWADDHVGAENYNNVRTGYARVDETCLRSGFDGRTEAHELMHTLGGVQSTAPHASPNGHCLDDADRMCYDDDGSGVAGVSVVCSSSNELRFDCHNDDYFYASPACGKGGWLATHWNTADNRWLESTLGGSRAAPLNDSVTGVTRLAAYSGSVTGSNDGATAESGERAHDGKPGGRSVWYSWTAPVAGPVSFDTCGSDTDTLLAVYTGQATTPLSLTPVASDDDDARLGQQSRVNFTATAGTTYLIAVDGKSGDQGGLALRWGAPFHGYPDAPVGAKYEAALNWARSRGVATGYSDNTFRPSTEATRSQVVAMLWQMVDRPAGAPTAAFSDVPGSASYRTALNWAIANQAISGYADGTFRPDGKLKRSQLATMLWNAAGHPAAPAASFSDVAPTSKIAAAVSWATAEGLLSGYSDGTFRPKSTMTRAQVATALYDMARTAHAWKYFPGSRPPSTVVFAP